MWMETRFLWAPLLIFVAGYLLLRIAGKRAVASMSNFDMFVVAAMGSTFGGFLADQNSLPRTLGSVAVLTATYLAFSYLMLNNKARTVMMAKPSVLIYKGHINEQGMRSARVTLPELLGHLRIKGYAAVSDVEFALMEEAGEISVIPKAQYRPVQPGDLNLTVAPAARPVPVLMDGDWIEGNLQTLKRDKKYVIMQLQKHGISSSDVEHLSLVTVDDAGTVWYDVNDAAGTGQGMPPFNSPEQASTGVLNQASRKQTTENEMEK